MEGGREGSAVKRGREGTEGWTVSEGGRGGERGREVGGGREGGREVGQ